MIYWTDCKLHKVEMSSVTISGESSRNYIHIERIEYEECYPSYQFAISINQPPFQGIMNIWVEATAFKSFLDEFAECERTRRGEATLASMSPDEFSLRIFNTHSKGDFSLTYEIRDYRGKFPPQLQGGFELDVSRLAQILNNFVKFID